MERVGIVGNGFTLGPESYPSSLRPNIRSPGPGIHGQTGLARINAGSLTCVQYALPDHRSQTAEALQCPPGDSIHQFALSLIQERARLWVFLSHSKDTSQSCGANMHSVHSFLTGTRRLNLSAAAWGIHPSPCMGIDAFIASPTFNLG